MGPRSTTSDNSYREIITSIEDVDRERGLFYDRPTKLCPMQIPSYSGTPSEDFIIFRDRFREAAKDNKISKTDQARFMLVNVLYI